LSSLKYPEQYLFCPQVNMQAVNPSMKVVQGSELLASVNNLLGLSSTCLINFNVTSAERRRDAPPAGPPLTRIETCDDSQARDILWGSTGFPVAVLIPFSCILTSMLASCSVRQQQLSALHYSPLEMHFAPGTDLATEKFLCINYA
jgi:hypothetical protein